MDVEDLIASGRLFQILNPLNLTKNARVFFLAKRVKMLDFERTLIGILFAIAYYDLCSSDCNENLTKLHLFSGHKLRL